MFKFVNKLILIVGVFLCFLTSSSAQYFEAGAKLGLSSYWGDLSVPDFETNLSNAKFAGAIFMKYNINGTYGVAASLMHSNLTGDDSQSNIDWQLRRNLSFKTAITEFAVRGEVNAFEFDASNGDQVFAPYFFLGVNMFYFNPKALYFGKYIDLQPLGTEGQGISGYGSKYSRLSGAFIYGGGLKFKVTETINFGIELIANRGFTDYLDDVSTEFVDYDVLKSNNGDLAAVLSNRSAEAGFVPSPTGGMRGGRTVPDYYLNGMLTLSYNFIGRNKLSLFKKKNNVSCPNY